jgi:3alpha(or 20beta)-hydroxysteroid dehydrogenase
VGRLDGKVALITGGARGMGESHVRRFVVEGARVFFVDRLEAEGARLARELGPAASFSVADVSQEGDWLRIVEAAEATFGPVSVLVNNAGIVRAGPLEEMSEADYRAVIDVNQIGTFLGMKTTVPSMRRAGGGSIVNISSVSGILGRPGAVAYTASKYAVTGMTKVAAGEFGQDNIRVNSVHPGAIATPIFDAIAREKVDALTGNLPFPRMGRPDEVTNLVLFLASDESSYCTASEFVVDGGDFGSPSSRAARPDT